jgi:NADH-quinone oxidoreductase subunit L
LNFFAIEFAELTVMEWLNKNVLWLIPAAPLLACLWIVLIGHVVRRKYAHRPLVAGLSVSFAASLYLMLMVVPHGFGHGEHDASHAVTTTIYEWINIGTLDIPVVLRADAMSALMLTMVTSVSLLVAIFASSYMTGDPGYPRFFAAMSLFVFSMCMLVLAGNFLLMFVFWEAVGLCSYLLIGFWFHKPSAAAAAKKAFVVNRIGDFGFILAILLIWQTFGTLDFAQLFESPTLIGEIAQTITPGDHINIFHWICLLLFVGAVGKSAQFPLQVWLPDAMEGPTPVSALIHAATMVTAGVYLVARCTPLFVHAPYIQMGVAGIGAATALIAAITALTQYDLKRVLAYSTVSQLGYMFMALGAAGGGEDLAIHAVTFAMFHMFTHAFFKAVLFLSAGSVMHSMGDVIDMRRFSGLRKALPITHWTFLAGALALAGVPLLSGFWSKDEILAVLSAASKGSEHGGYYAIILGIALFASLLTAFYTFRAYFMTFWGEEKFPEEAGHHPHDAPPAMAGPLAILAVAALGIGLLTGPTHLYGHYLHHTPGLPEGHEFPMDFGMMAISSLLALGGIGVAYMMYVVSPGIPANIQRRFSLGFKLSQEGLYIDWFGYKFIANPIRGFATICELFDRWVVDTLVDCVGFIPGLFGAIIRPVQNGMVQNYGAVMMIGLVVCLITVLRALAGTM